MKGLSTTLIIVVTAVVILVAALVILTIFGGGVGNVATISQAQSLCRSSADSTCRSSNTFPVTWSIPNMVVQQTDGTSKVQSCKDLLPSGCACTANVFSGC